MTKEEAIRLLSGLMFKGKLKEALDMAIKALEQELNKSEIPTGSTTKNDLGIDCISRADVLKLMKDNWHTHDGDWAMQESMDDIRALPSVTPQEPKTGHWIPTTKNWWECSECGQIIYSGAESNKLKFHAFCGRCGARMIDVPDINDGKLSGILTGSESEDKE